MLLLVVDTAGPTGGVLLAEEVGGGAGEHRADTETKILGEIELHPRLFSAELIPAIAALLRSHHRKLADLDAFAVVSGPGSFTGLRVGLSAVKAMAEVSGKPILTVSQLAVMAAMAAKLPSRTCRRRCRAYRARCGKKRILLRRLSRPRENPGGRVV